MSISLSKNQKISLAKPTGQGLNKIMIGAGWDVAQSKIGSFFGGGGGSIDLDVSLICLDADGNVLETVWFRNLKNSNGSIIHKGDNLTGVGDGDDEVITVDIPNLPPKTKTLVTTISSFRGQTFDRVQNAFCRVVDMDDNKEQARFNLSESGNYTSLIISKFQVNHGIWSMTALGVKCQGTTINDLLPEIRKIL